ncbi:patatin-like phospholipase family protein [Bowmanella yangjiangensis]|uniref:Patatin-like phospholipase family protein n=1 Tax=Bowmanella yangjiangensis TaxID=2811230 RepID=A0ABS3CRT7_9ALTE|nr:patatin-like phospholipase family protein [Bowmanella yangjiangensis]MBN7819832.1 patatin-like phospholipase family protein [Bowmanella yangjiangensis]
MSVLELYAGPAAYRQIQDEGLHADLFDYMLGASGGPKWFVLAGLDRVIFPQLFAGRDRPIQAIGSSAGAFRFACFAQNDSLAAINRLAERYSHTVYSTKPDAREISLKGRELLDYVLGESGISEILTNPIVKAHFIVARCRGWLARESKPLQMSGLLASAGANLIRRRWLSGFYQRYSFGAPGSELHIQDPMGMASYQVPLSHANLKAALMASGSIPLILEGVQDIPGAPPGMYRDGGIIDYHFDLSFGPMPGLVLYPHFNRRAVPGWFDKSLSYRRPAHSSYDKVLMVVPSAEFIASLPFGKIPDRKDFEQMPAEQRIPYWQKVLSESDRLGEAFSQLLGKRDIASQIRPIGFTR